MYVTCKYDRHKCITIAINFEGSTKQTWSKLSAGTHNIKIKFIPTNFPELFALETCQFNVEPMGKFSIEFALCIIHGKILNN